MGSHLCSHEDTFSHSIQQKQFSRSQQILSKNLDSETVEFIKSHFLPMWKQKGNQKYYCGDFKNGKGQGPCIIYVPGSFYFKGHLQKGLPHGQGTLNHLSRNQLYQGQFQRGMAHGPGKLRNNSKNNGFYFEGEWHDSQAIKGKLYPIMNRQIDSIQITNFANYEGIIKLKKGDIYEGQLNAYMEPHGHGVLKYHNGSKVNEYVGQWFRGKFNGQGKCRWVDGSEYYGSYVNGVKQGQGTFRFPSGNRYQGHWLEGIYHGKGTMYNNKNQIISKGIWIKGVPMSDIKFEQQKNLSRILQSQKLPIIYEHELKYIQNKRNDEMLQSKEIV